MTRRISTSIVVLAMLCTLTVVGGAAAQAAEPDGHATAEGAVPATGGGNDPSRLPPPAVTAIDAVIGLKALDADVLADGRVLVAGRFAGAVTLPDGTVVSSDGGVDGFVARLAPDGTMELFRRFGGTDNDALSAVAGTPDGGFVVAGHLVDGGTVGRVARFPIGGTPGRGVAVLRWDAGDQLAWDRIDEVPGGSSVATALDVADDGTVAVAGWREGPVSLGGRDLGSTLWRRGWVGAVDDGDVRWLTSSLAWTEVDEVAVTDDGHVGAMTRSFGAPRIERLGLGDGEPTWVEFVDSDPDAPVPMAALPGGGLAVAVADHGESEDATLIELDARGHRAATTEIGPSYLAPLALEADGTGDVRLLADASPGTRQQFFEPIETYVDDAWHRPLVAIELAPDRQARWTASVSTPTNHRPLGVGLAAPGRPLVVVGTSPTASDLQTHDATHVGRLGAPGTFVVRHAPVTLPGDEPADPSGSVTVSGSRYLHSTPLDDGTAVIGFEAYGEVRITGTRTDTTVPAQRSAVTLVRLDGDGRVFDRVAVPAARLYDLAAGPEGSTLILANLYGADLPDPAGTTARRSGVHAVLVDTTGTVRWAVPADGIGATDAGPLLSSGDRLDRVGPDGPTPWVVDSTITSLLDTTPDGHALVTSIGSALQLRGPDGALRWWSTSDDASLLDDGTVVFVTRYPERLRINGAALTGVNPSPRSSTGLATAVAVAPDGSVRWTRTIGSYNDDTAAGPDGTVAVVAHRPDGDDVGRHLLDAADGTVRRATIEGWRPAGSARSGSRHHLVSYDATAAHVEWWGAGIAGPGALDVTATGPAGAVSGATVDALRLDTFPAPRLAKLATGTTDASGRVTLEVPPGRYAVRVIDTSGVHLTTWAGMESKVWKADRFLAVPGRTTPVPVSMPADLDGTIEGTVEDDAGAPAAGVVAWLFDASGWRAAVATDAAGRYRFPEMFPGTYRVTFVDPAGRLIPEWWLDATAEGATPIVVADAPATADAVLTRRRTDLHVEVVGGPTSLRPGGHGLTHVSVTNEGVDITPDVQVDLDLPTELAATAAISATSGEATGTHWDVGTLLPGQRATMTVDLAVDETAPAAQLVYGATAAAPALDDDPADDSATATLDVVAGDDVAGLWATMVKGPGTALGYGVAIGDDGATYVSGWFLGTITFGEGPGAVTWTNNRGAPDMFFLKLGPDGTTQWVRRGTTQPRRDPTGGDVVVDHDGNLYVVGFYEGTASFTGSGTTGTTLRSAGGMDAFLLKYGPDGSLLWSRSIGGWSADYGWSAELGPDGDVVVSGRHGYGFVAGEVAAPPTSSGGFVLRYDPDGAVVGSAFLHATSGDVDSLVRALDVQADGSVVLAGSFAGTLTVDREVGGATSAVSRGGLDGFAVHLEPLVGESPTVRWFGHDGGPGDDRWTGATMSATGELTLVGRFADDATAAGQPLPASSGVVVRLGNDHAIRWIRDLALPVRKVLTSPGGQTVLYGGLEGTTTFATPTGPATVSAAGPADGLVLALDDRGLVTDWTTFGGAERDVAVGLALAPDGSLHLSGSIVGDADVCRGPDARRVAAIGQPNNVIARCAPLG